MGGVTSVKVPLTSQLDWLVAERDKTDRRGGGGGIDRHSRVRN